MEELFKEGAFSDIANSWRKIADLTEDSKIFPAQLSKLMADYYRQIASQTEAIRTEEDYLRVRKNLGRLENFHNNLIHELKKIEKEETDN